MKSLGQFSGNSDTWATNLHFKFYINHDTKATYFIQKPTVYFTQLKYDLPSNYITFLYTKENE